MVTPSQGHHEAASSVPGTCLILTCHTRVRHYRPLAVDGEQRNAWRLFVPINPLWAPESASQRLGRHFQPRPRGNAVRIAATATLLVREFTYNFLHHWLLKPFLLAI
jgi:hypothetical protein